jgi:hypothetical protein
MTTIPDENVRPRPGGLIREEGEPQTIQDLERDPLVRPTPAREDGRIEREERDSEQ